MLQLGDIPNLNVNVPQMPSVADTAEKGLQLKNLMGQQQLIPLQIQEQQERLKQQQIQNSMLETEKNSQQAMIKAWSDPDFLKTLTGSDKAQSSGLGFDPDAMTAGLVSKGVLPKDAMATTQSFVERSQKIAATQKDVAQTGEANASIREKGMKILADKIGGVLDLPTAKAADALAELKQDLVKNPKNYAGVPQEDLAHVYSADLEHLPAMATLIGLDSKIADFHKSKADAIKAQQGVIDPKTGMSPEQIGEGNKEVAVLKAEQPLKLQQAEAQGRAMQLIKGIEQPVYAFHPDGTKELMSSTDAIKAGLHTMMPVGAKEVSDDTMLINRLGDVRQKISQYEQNLANLGKTVSSKDQGNIAGLLDKGGFKVGAFGTELPMSRLNAALDKENIKGLSEDAKKLLVSYYNARESMQGYQRVLSGSGRSNEKAMELNLDALPNPATTDSDFAAESMKQFRQNLQVVGQGLPKIPGVKSPEEFEAQATGSSSANAQKKTKASKYGVEIP